MKLKALFSFSIIIFLSVSLNAQCPWNKRNCSHGCGRHIDANNNGLCDFSEEKKIDDTATKVIPPKEEKPKKKATGCNHDCSGCNGCKIGAKKIEVDSVLPVEKETSAAAITPDSTKGAVLATAEKKVDVDTKSKPYDLISISLITLGLYCVSWWIVSAKRRRLSSHRRLWNVLLLLTFLVSCLFGFFLVVQINYGIVISWYRSVLYWHVQVGIAMTIIALIHAIWHAKYYISMFKK